MSKKRQHIDKNSGEYLKYLNEGLSGKERHDFEKKIMQDKFEEEAFEGLTQLDAEQYAGDISELSASIERRSAPKRIIFTPFIRYAAAVVLLLGTGSIIYLVRQTAGSMREIARNEAINDSVVTSPALPVEEDTLKNNIAYVPEAVEEAPVIEESNTPAEIEPVVSEPEESELSKVTIPEVELKKEISNERAVNKDLEKALSGQASGVEVSRSEDGGTPYHELYTTRSDKAKRTTSRARPGEMMMVKGRVISSADEEPLPGVNVVVRGSSSGTVSDINGNFTLNVPSDTVVLEFAFIGYETEEIEVQDQKEMTITLNEDLVALDEVVVVGYGAMKKSDLTGAVSTIYADDLTNQPSDIPVIIEPKPVKGWSEYRDYIKKNIDYSILPEFNKPLTIKLNIIISASGTLNSIVVERSENPSFDQEAIRLVREGPAWLPGSRDGVKSEMEVTVKIRFEPQE